MKKIDIKKQKENGDEKRVLAEYSELNQTELYRSYGAKKKEGFFAHLNDKIATLLLVVLYAFQIAIWALGVFWLTVLLGTIGIFLAVCAISAFVWWKFFRVFRKRVKFILKLKKTCKNLGYKIKFHRGFFKGLRFNKTGIDFTVDTGKKLWTVRFLPCRKYNMDLIFEDEKTIVMKTNPLRLKGSLMNTDDPRANRVMGVFGLTNLFKRGKTKTINYSFTELEEKMYGKTERALIINPVPHTMLKKEKDGATYETGTGEKMWGYTAFSGTGFINKLKQESVE